MGFEHRSVCVKRDGVSPKRVPKKTFPTTVNTLVDHIHVKRVENGLLARELAERVGIPTSVIRLWERDIQKPSDTEWQSLTAILGLPPDVMGTKFNR
ncbi:MAG: helix-turn-helix transcriptional regulator [Verrucomicrobia bacterium]|nr:helix-turn-helix transcriptional regulator [Verrucomicrobiota bacterium]